MERKVRFLIVLVCACVLAIGSPKQAHAYDFNASHVEYLSGYIDRYGVFKDYLIYFTDNTQTVLVLGDLSFSDDVYSWSDSVIYTVCDSDTGIVVDVVDSPSGSVNVSNYLGYSSLGNLPLLDGGVIYEKITIFVLVLGFSYMFIVSFCARKAYRV